MVGHKGFRKGVSGNPAGRPKGSKDKRSADQKELIARAVANGNQTPLEIMLEVANDPRNSKTLRLTAANFAAPYVHCKFGPIPGAPVYGTPSECANAIREQLAALNAVAGKA